MKISRGQFWLGDCLELMKKIPSGSVDMILCDLPYGTTQNKWDTIIPFEPLWKQYWRIAKPNAAVVLTASQPFTSLLIMSQIDNFKYSWVWKKSKATGFLDAKRKPLKEHEDICIFYKKQSCYNPQGTIETKVNSGRKNKAGNGNFGKVSDKPYIQTVGNFPRSILEMQHETKPVHPTQKPVALFEYLIRTYTNPGETVLDNCAGSGTTAVAAERTERQWICIEKDPAYYYGAIGRVWGECQ